MSLANSAAEHSAWIDVSCGRPGRCHRGRRGGGRARPPRSPRTVLSAASCVGLIHFFAYHLILARRRTRVTRAAGFRLTVRPTVFHPRYFLSSEWFAEFIGHLDLGGKRVLDVGTGSGILALAAARAGAEYVIAADINPNAALSAAENARANGVGDRVSALCSDLLSALAPRPLFDVILSSPPKHAGEPRDLADRGWHAGPRYRDIAALFEQSRERLKPGGRLFVMVSSDTDLDLFGRLIDRAGFRARLAHERSILIESLDHLRIARPLGADPAAKQSRYRSRQTRTSVTAGSRARRGSRRRCARGSGCRAFRATGANGTGVCGAVTRRTGAFSAANALSATRAAMSAAMLQRGVASSTTTSRPVRSTLSRIVSSSKGEVVRGSINSHSIPSPASVSAASAA